MIHVSASLLKETFARFRACGGGRRECVAYWLGPVEDEHLVDEVVHPDHHSSGAGYRIDDRWLTDFGFSLAHRRKSVRVQVHTHPGKAFHSTTDDEWALINTVGFLSLVIPYFGRGPVGLENAYLAELTEHGWCTIPPEACLQIGPDLLKGDE